MRRADDGAGGSPIDGPQGNSATRGCGPGQPNRAKAPAGRSRCGREAHLRCSRRRPSPRRQGDRQLGDPLDDERRRGSTPTSATAARWPVRPATRRPSSGSDRRADGCSSREFGWESGVERGALSTDWAGTPARGRLCVPGCGVLGGRRRLRDDLGAAGTPSGASGGPVPGRSAGVERAPPRAATGRSPG